MNNTTIFPLEIIKSINFKEVIIDGLDLLSFKNILYSVLFICPSRNDWTKLLKFLDYIQIGIILSTKKQQQNCKTLSWIVNIFPCNILSLSYASTIIILETFIVPFIWIFKFSNAVSSIISCSRYKSHNKQFSGWLLLL